MKKYSIFLLAGFLYTGHFSGMKREERDFFLNEFFRNQVSYGERVCATNQFLSGKFERVLKNSGVIENGHYIRYSCLIDKNAQLDRFLFIVKLSREGHSPEFFGVKSYCKYDKAYLNEDVDGSFEKLATQIDTLFDMPEVQQQQQ